VGGNDMSDILQTSLAMQRLVDFISMATHERNNGKKLHFLFGPQEDMA
jgi:hypothetical protein